MESLCAAKTQRTLNKWNFKKLIWSKNWEYRQLFPCSALSPAPDKIVRGSHVGLGIYNQTTDPGKEPFTSSTELFKTLTQWRMSQFPKRNIFQEGKKVIIIEYSTFACFPWIPKLATPMGLENSLSSEYHSFHCVYIFPHTSALALFLIYLVSLSNISTILTF